jgi:pimeloyl-ACP methyl ester carboxylesterase
VSSVGGLHYDRYGSTEWLMRIGDGDAPPILFLPPLFEELNRTRALIVAMMRRLAAGGFGCWLPDLPGTGESERPLETVRWEDWREAARLAAAHIGRRPVVVTVRGGCLLDEAVDAFARYRFAPVQGASLARDLARSGMISGGAAGGYTLGDALLARLKEVEPPATGQVRTARLASDPAPGDIKFDGPALWRRSEPGNAPGLAYALAEDIGKWVAQCDIF